jgi:hypothetical protein
VTASPTADARPRAPWPLRWAAAVTAVEALVFLVLSGFQVPGMQGEKLAMNATTFLFFVGYAAFLLLCAWQLLRLHSWARAPVVLAQILQIIIGVEFYGGRTSAVTVVAVLLAVVTLVGIFHPASLRALDDTVGHG